MPFLNLLHTRSSTVKSHDLLPVVTIITLSVAAVIISGAIYGCYVKYVKQIKDCLCLVSVSELYEKAQILLPACCVYVSRV